jgi:photosystem II stability/assembly factor-like uncharacterized protein
MSVPARALASRTRVAALAIATGALLALLAASMFGADPATAASSAVTVSMNVPSAIQYSDQCTDAAAGFQFGVVLPGASQLTDVGSDVCRFSFQSSNDTAMLRMSQADQAAPALSTDTGTFTYVSGTSYGTFDAVETVPGNSAIAWAVSQSGKIYKTANSGTTWTQVAGATGSYRDVDVVDATHAYAVGNGGAFWSTADGTTWVNKTASLAAPNMLDVAIAVDMNTVYVVGDGGGVYMTTTATNASTTWNRIGVAGWGTSLSTTVNYRSGDNAGTTVFLGDAQGGVWRTTDAGVNWTLIPTGTGTCSGVSAQSIEGMVAVSANVIYTAGYTGTMLKSVNASGASPCFSTLNVPVRASMYGIDAIDATNVYAVGDRGTMLRTTDGTTWSVVATGTFENLRGIAYEAAPSARFYAVGSSLEVDTSTNGTAWTNQQRVGHTLLAVAAYDGTDAWAVGLGGLVRHTGDGATWTTQVSGTTEDLWSVAAIDRTTAWAVGSNGTVLRTNDGGTTWTASSIGSANLRAIAAVDGNVAFVAGLGGTVLRTTNGGTSWSDVSSGVTDYWAVAATDANTAWVAGDGGVVKSTTTAGAGWTSIGGGALGTRNLRAVAAATGGQVFVSGFDTSGYGGAAWRLSGGAWVQVMSTYEPVWALSTPRDSGATAATTAVFGAAQKFWASQDGGVTQAGRGTPYALMYGVSAVDHHTAFGVGDAGQIFHLTEGPGINDYAGGSQDWDQGSSAFGVCLQAKGATTTPDAAWTVDPGGACTTVDTDPWKAVPTTSTKVAKTTVAGGIGQVDLVFGVRAATNQAPGTYRASVLFEFLAPDV